jgi:plastocyanin
LELGNPPKTAIEIPSLDYACLIALSGLRIRAPMHQRIPFRKELMIMNKPMASIAIAAGVALVCASPVSFAKEHEEESINSSDVPAAVQKAAEGEAKGGNIVRWEKEGKNYEAVIEKDGKQTGVEISAKGKVLSRHDEKKEHAEKGEKHED